MVDAVLAKVFGTRNEREVKAMRPTVAAINDLEPAMQQLSDIDLAAKTIEFKEKLARGASLDDILIEAFAVVREAGRRVLEHAPFRRPDDRRHGAPQRPHRRNEDRRRKNPRRHRARLSQRARRQRRPHHHRQRLPRQTRLRMDGPHPPFPRPHRRHHRARSRRRPAPGKLRLRHHLRHQ